MVCVGGRQRARKRGNMRARAVWGRARCAQARPPIKWAHPRPRGQARERVRGEVAVTLQLAENQLQASLSFSLSVPRARELVREEVEGLCRLAGHSEPAYAYVQVARVPLLGYPN